jgi:hypothetical protein
MPWAVAAAGVGAVGAYESSKNNKEAAQIASQQHIDPRIDNILFGGSNGNGPQTGLLSQYQSMLTQPQAMQGYQQAGADYLNQYGKSDMGAIHDAAGNLIKGNQAPTTSPSAWAVGNQVQAPSQNGMDLSGSYNSLINDAPGASPFLTGAIQKGIDQSSNAFTQMQQGATDNLMKNVLPSIRSNSVLAGQYGGSRQGVAEGNAIGDFAKAQQQAASQFGQNNTDAAVAAQAGQYNNDRNLQLAATQGLGAQQYGVAQQDANTKNQAEFMNVGNVQQSNLANQGAQLATNAQNTGSALGGAGLLGGLTSGAVGAVNSDLPRAQAVNGLLTPYLGVNNSSSQPVYQNTAGNVLGGAMAGLGLYNGLTGGKSGGGTNWGGIFDLFSKDYMNY